MARAISMEPAEDQVCGRSKTDADTRFAERVCLPLLRSAQNEDGGWGYHPGSQSRVEATCWALQAVLGSASSERADAIAAPAFRFLRAAQLPDGSWPSVPTLEQGCWVTSLACWTLLSDKDSGRAIAAGLHWLCDDWPRDSGWWQRLLSSFSADRHLASHNDSYRGWGWTPRTSSWVEPTSFALIALSLSLETLLPGGAAQRRKLAEAMLYDRMCPGGGWNCGNPSVYGVPGDPLVIPTVWALLALRDYPDRRENVASLEWLERNLVHVEGPGSLALARICLEVYGRGWPMIGVGPCDSYRRNEFLRNIPVVAWMCLAWGGRRHWLMSASREMV
jgi:hypothetical protein